MIYVLVVLYTRLMTNPLTGIRCTRFPSVMRRAKRLLMGTRTGIATRNPSWWARPRWPCTLGRPSLPRKPVNPTPAWRSRWRLCWLFHWRGPVHLCAIHKNITKYYNWKFLVYIYMWIRCSRMAFITFNLFTIVQKSFELMFRTFEPSLSIDKWC